MLLHNTGQVKPDFYPIINSTQLLYVFFHPGPAVKEHSAAHSQCSGIMTTRLVLTRLYLKSVVLINLMDFFYIGCLVFVAAIPFFNPGQQQHDDNTSFMDMQVVFCAIHSPESTKKMSRSCILLILAADSLKGNLDNGR